MMEKCQNSLDLLISPCIFLYNWQDEEDKFEMRWKSIKRYVVCRPFLINGARQSNKGPFHGLLFLKVGVALITLWRRRIFFLGGGVPDHTEIVGLLD